MQKCFTILVLAGILLSYGCASTQLKRVDILKEPDTYKRIQVLTDRLLQVMDSENIHKYRYSIVESDMPQAYAVCSNRTLLVYRGLLNEYSDDELMFILAHEITHIKLRHCQGRKNATNSQIREQELAADMEAVKAVQQNFGIPASEYIDVLTRLRAYTENNGHRGDEGFDTHPAFNDRIRVITRLYRASLDDKGGLKSAPGIDVEPANEAAAAKDILALVDSQEKKGAPSLH